MHTAMAVEAPDDVVRTAVDALSAACAERDVDAAIARFTPQGAIFGDDVAEQALGRGELGPFFAEVFEESWTLAWSLGEVWTRQSHDVIWFVAEATVLRRETSGARSSRAPFRLAGVLRRQAGQWRFELFAASQPVSGASVTAIA